MQEVEKSKFKMYRSVGRMFVIADPADLKKDLQVDLDKIKAEHDRSAEMQKNFEAKKIILTSQLNDLTPKAKWPLIDNLTFTIKNQIQLLDAFLNINHFQTNFAQLSVTVWNLNQVAPLWLLECEILVFTLIVIFFVLRLWSFLFCCIIAIWNVLPFLWC